MDKSGLTRGRAETLQLDFTVVDVTQSGPLHAFLASVPLAVALLRAASPILTLRLWVILLAAEAFQLAAHHLPYRRSNRRPHQSVRNFARFSFSALQEGFSQFSWFMVVVGSFGFDTNTLSRG